MDNSSDTVLKKRVAPRLKIICCSICTAAMLFYYVIKTTLADAESREEQNGSKHKFVGGKAVMIWLHLRQGAAKPRKRNENERFKLC